jgi:hypothetical protein
MYQLLSIQNHWETCVLHNSSEKVQGVFLAELALEGQFKEQLKLVMLPAKLWKS